MSQSQSQYLNKFKQLLTKFISEDAIETFFASVNNSEDIYISGSIILQAASEENFTDYDLDIYCKPDANIEQLKNLLNEANYKIKKTAILPKNKNIQYDDDGKVMDTMCGNNLSTYFGFKQYINKIDYYARDLNKVQIIYMNDGVDVQEFILNKFDLNIIKNYYHNASFYIHDIDAINRKIAHINMNYLIESALTSKASLDLFHSRFVKYRVDRDFTIYLQEFKLTQQLFDHLYEMQEKLQLFKSDFFANADIVTSDEITISNNFTTNYNLTDVEFVNLEEIDEEWEGYDDNKLEYYVKLNETNAIFNKYCKLYANDNKYYSQYNVYIDHYRYYYDIITKFIDNNC